MTENSKNYLFDGGRLKEPVAESIRNFTSENLSTERIKEELALGLRVDKAHVVMLAEQGIIEKTDASAILNFLDNTQKAGPEKFCVNHTQGGTYAQIEALLIRHTGHKTGGQLHIGRSRIDRMSTVSRLATRKILLKMMKQALAFQEVILNKARQHTDTVMPGYTHMQHAQPLTLGHYLSGYSERLQRDIQRMADAFPRLNQCPLGSAALAGTSWPLNRARTAQLLGFDQEIRNARDAGIFYKDYNLEIISDLAILATTLSHLANEFYIWHSYEFNFIELSDAYTASSSMMPQKKNPHALDIIKSLCAYIIGLPGVEFSMHRMCTSSDLDATFSRSGVQTGGEKMLTVLDIFCGALASMQVNRKIMRRQAGAHWSTTVNLADELTRKNKISFRDSHKICGRFVRLAMSRNLTPCNATGALLNQAAMEIIGEPLNWDDEFVQKALDPEQFIQTRSTSGGTKPAETERILVQQRKEYLKMQQWLKNLETGLESADKELEQAVEKISIGSLI